MSKESWSLTSAKRKAKSATPAPRKRPRFNDVENTRRQSQQTLTQAQWMTPISTSFDENDMQYQEYKRPRTVSVGRSTLKRADSTLTQMDFFSFEERDDSAFDDTLLPTVEPQPSQLTVPQLDGAYDSPRKPRKRKASPATSHRSTKRKNTPTNQESQEYKPRKKKGKVDVTDNQVLDSGRRTSSRLASKMSIFWDADENLQYFEEALAVPPAPPRTPAGRKMPVLEIKDSVDDGEEEGVEGVRPSQDRRKLETPKTSRKVIFSSQSPESLPPSTHRANRKSTTTPASERTPLAARSANVLLQPSPKRSTGKLRRTAKRSPIRSKVVVFKLPKRSQGKRVTRIEDSEANLWSIPSSSPKLQRSAEDLPKQVPALNRTTSNEAEIPASSQIQPIKSSPPVPSQDSLPDLATLVGSKAKGTKADAERVVSNPSSDIPQNEESPVLVRDFAHLPAGTGGGEVTEAGNEEEILLAHNVSAVRSAVVEQETEFEGEELDFGSPIANDTQFNNHVQHRVSSPSPQATRTPLKIDQNAVIREALSPSSPTPRARPTTQRREEVVIVSSSDEKPPQTPLPLPRLVESPSARNPDVLMELDSEDDEITLPKPPLLHQSSTHISTTQVPLNDVPKFSSSSSLPATKAVTEKSMHPASMPHPSQMSTQEATQGLLNLSSYPQQRMETQFPGRPDRITIKDSSSYRVPISQLPQYTGPDRSQPNMDEVIDSEEEADLDLDPPSTAPQPELPALDDRELLNPVLPASKDQVDEDSQAGHALISPGQGPSQSRNADSTETPIHSSQEVSIPSSPIPPPLQRRYSPIPGFDNDTQSNFTQNGHVTAAYIHRQREAGVMPKCGAWQQ
ncbi:hypothetical protein LTR10_012740 [Elasticomyces elasticus]|uniref:Shugoshin C-terminal domain-containing protein n=1 Tax=Exophiala sideris TaxID=1016849 RepID=A0ABR0JR73_9EURO|nr:hypothetical protein LTR10_012740 [Elasticomyces elasticus]KAK5034617.1 hypothetical protein LTR13_006273 [Exophiala sideris]KAK5040061.1 hypothetical protein LTS07_000557 [Exophiala sideris]KAK5068439.1 hypothetical protein LTR69_000558 [Exophiala sideris]KAK5187741.1 hypothetical protein LTR44_000558 [Eurotiomycetes sp. CCFEE 6388]